MYFWNIRWVKALITIICLLCILGLGRLGWHWKTRPASPSSRPDIPLHSIAAPATPDEAAFSKMPSSLNKRFQARQTLNRLPLRFEAHPGLTDASKDFIARGAGYQVTLNATEATIYLSPLKHANHRGRMLSEKEGEPAAQPLPVNKLRMILLGANAKAKAEQIEPLPGQSHYFIGSSPGGWRTGIAQSARIHYQDVYPGIDLVYYGNQQQLEYDFIVSPGIDTRTIRLSFSNAEKLSLEANGDLALRVAGAELRQHKPVLYQNVNGRRKMVEGRYAIRNDGVGFEVGQYDSSLPLVIDPVLSYSTYLGGDNEDSILFLTTDSAGNVYFVGETQSLDFPVVNAFQPMKRETSPPSCANAGGCTDVIAGKMNAAGTALLFSTYLGGRHADSGLGLDFDAAGNVYLAGTTQSTDFPVSSGAFQPIRQGNSFSGRDAFVSKLSADGGTLIYSSFLGGLRSDRAFWVEADKAGNAWVVGRTDSPDFPFARPYRADKGDLFNFDGFVTKVSADGASLLFSTYLGGSDDDQINSVALDAEGSAYVTGSTVSTDFPTTAGAYQPAYKGSDEVFVSKFSADGEQLIFSTYVGGTGADVGLTVALDGESNVYVTGFSASFGGHFDFPLINPIQRETKWEQGLGPPLDALIFKLSADGSRLLYSTYFGATFPEQAVGPIAIDAGGRIYLSGYTASNDLPVTPDAIQPDFGNGLHDAFVAVIDPARTGWESLRYASYLGGVADDFGQSAGLDAQGNLYIGGVTIAYPGNPPNNFPTANPLQPLIKGFSDGFLSKISLSAQSGKDQVPPTVIITSPTTAAEFTSASPRLLLSGTATDDTGVTHVYWRKEQTETDLANGIAWGRAQGTTSWTTREIILQTGVNRLIVTARDAAGNWGTATLTIRYQPEYIITTYAGGGDRLGDELLATQLHLQDGPIAVITDRAGNVYFSGLGYGINVNVRAVWKVTPTGIATRVAGTGMAGSLGDGGPATEARLNSPYALALDEDGNLYIADDASGLVRKVAPNGVISTLAGDKNQLGCSYSGDGGPATAARFCGVRGVAADRAGNVYIADSGNNRVRRVDRNGIVTTFAGNGELGLGGDGGPATSAQVPAPHGLVFDANENLYIATGEHIRRVSRDGIITTVAGGGNSTGDGIPATSARLVTVTALAVDRDGNLLIGAPDTQRIRRINSSGLIETIAGSGQQGFTGDGVASHLARLAVPYGVAGDAQGRIFIADAGNQRIRVLTPVVPNDTGAPEIKITAPTSGGSYASALPFVTLAGTAADNSGITQIRWSNDRGGSGFAAGTNFWHAAGLPLAAGLNRLTITAKDTAGATASAIIEVNYSPDTEPPVVAIITPASTGVYTASKVLLNITGTARDNVGIARIRWRDERGSGGPVEGLHNWTISGYELHAGSNRLHVLAEDVAGNISQARLTINYSPEYLIYTVAGPGSGEEYNPQATAGLPARHAFIAAPLAVAFDAENNLYIGESGVFRIRRVTPNGLIKTVAGNGNQGLSEDGIAALEATIGEPHGIAFDAAGILHFSDGSRIRKILPNGTLQTVAGRIGVAGFSGDGGPATQAQLNGPAGLAFDRAGNLFIADRHNSRIRKVTPDGTITTVAGGQAAPNLGDGGPALQAQLSGPTGIAFDPAGNLLIADTGTSRIRKITPGGTITTVAGSGDFTGGFGGDGSPATAALLAGPRGVAVDAAGNLYITDHFNYRIRKVTTAGIINTIAGIGPPRGLEPLFRGEADAATYAKLALPTGIAIDSNGLIYFADQDNSRIRKLVAYSPTPSVASVSAASFQSALLARESIIAAFGGALATRTEIAAALPLPTLLGGTRVLVRDLLGVEREAPLFFVSASQINFQLPPGTSNGTATITVLNGNRPPLSGQTQIGSVAPGLFTANATGQGVAAAVALRIKADGTQTFEPIAQYDAARKQFVPLPLDLEPEGEQVYLILFGTGLRFRQSLPDVQALVGNNALPVLYAGAQGGFVGLDQVNLLLPRNLRGRGEVQCQLKISAETSNPVTIQIR